MSTVYRIFGLAMLLLLGLCGTGLAQDSLNVWEVARFSCWQEVRQIALRDSFAFVADEGSGLFVVNVANPQDPRVVFHAPVPDPVMASSATLGVAVVGDAAYVMEWDRMWVFNVADAAHPQFATSVPTQQSAEVLVLGHYLLIRGFDTNAMIYDIANPWLPTLVSTPQITYYYGADAANHYWFIPSGYEISIVDVADPVHPVEVSHLDNVNLVTSLAAYGDYLLVGTVGGLDVLSIADPANPGQVSFDDTLGNIQNVRVQGNRAYVSLQNGDVKIVDLTNPQSPTYLGSYAGDASTRLLAVNGTRCYVAASERGKRVEMVDVTDPLAPQRLGGFGELGPILDYQIVGNLAYLMTPAGLRVSVLDSGMTPRQIGWSSTPGNRVYVADGFAYTSDVSTRSLTVIDVSDSTLPHQVGALAGVFNPEGYASLGHYLYTFEQGEFTTTVRTISVFDPTNPTQVNLLTIGGSVTMPTQTIMRDSILYLGGSPSGLWMLNLWDPTAPVLVQSTPIEVFDLAAVDNFLYIASPGFSLDIYDISNPANPAYRNSLSQFLNCWTLTISAQHLIFYDQESWSFHVLNIENREQPVETGFYQAREISGKLITLSDSTVAMVRPSGYDFVVYGFARGLQAAPHREAGVSRFALQTCYPNPFNPSTEISFSLPRSEHATLRIFDVMGRRVSTLADGVLSAGDHRVSFDGAALPSGVYFARLQAGESVQTRKMMLVK